MARKSAAKRHLTDSGLSDLMYSRYQSRGVNRELVMTVFTFFATLASTVCLRESNAMTVKGGGAEYYALILFERGHDWRIFAKAAA